MGYLHIDNLYKNTEVLQHRDLVVLEKVHGTSAHLKWTGGTLLTYYSGGAKPKAFQALFDHDVLVAWLQHMSAELVVYGEAYGGAMQRCAHAYGPELRFIAFDVRQGGQWLDVLGAQAVATLLGLEFVPWELVTNLEPQQTLAALDHIRDRPSEVGVRRGINGAWREGVVIKPLVEAVDGFGKRVITKHKRPEARETKAPRNVGDALQVRAEAEDVAEEWVTETRLDHVLDHLRAGTCEGAEFDDISCTGDVVRAMQADVAREGAAEIAEFTPAVRAAVGKRAAQLFKARITKVVVGP